MKVIVTGGTGFLGWPLCQQLLRGGHQVTVFTRGAPPPGQPGPQYVTWQPGTAGYWQELIAVADAVINLAGESVAAGRWTARRQQRLIDSRVGTTRALVDAMAAASSRPSVLLTASAVGFYGPRGDEVLDESAAGGQGFLAELCQRWEGEAAKAQSLGIRVVRLRIGMVLGPDGGALQKLLPSFRLYVGGPLGSGRQWMSWIHRDDVIHGILLLLTRADARGAVNVTAPHPLTMRDFCRELGAALHRPSWLPAPSMALRLLLGPMADELLLTGQRVMPNQLLQWGYTFRFPTLARALADVLGSPAPHITTGV